MARITTLLGLACLPLLATAQLNELAHKAGLLWFGSAFSQAYSDDQAYMAIIDDTAEIGQLTPENEMKWENIEPEPGVFNYTGGNYIAGTARKNGQYLRCHTLTWYSQLPTWVSAGNWTYEELKFVIERHISHVVGHYRGACYSWDVVNEAVGDDGNWRSDVFYDVMGTDFIPISFKAAAAADPFAKLYYNDYNLEYNTNKTDKALELVHIARSSHARIDGVGFQGHLIVGSTPSRADLVTAMERFTDIGLDVAYTELDIRFESVPASAAGLAQQGQDYAAVVGSCTDLRGKCIGITQWEFTDKYSWVPATFPGQGEACLYDEDLKKKPAWTSVSSVLKAAATKKPEPHWPWRE